MKRLIFILLWVLLGISNAGRNDIKAATPYSPAYPVGVTFQVFYDELSPYGRWVDYPSYGYVWVPGVGAGFTPYCNGGHWEYTDDYGWIWVSDYAWGWGPFHYGRWFYEDAYGWMWVPGYDWAPAWVVWGSYNGYYGWAPIAPGIIVYAGYRPPAHYWTCVPYGRMYDRNVYNYRVHNTTVVNNITIINNERTYGSHQYFSGPRKEEVEKTSGRKVTTVAFSESGRPGETKVENKRIAMYRPAITKDAAVHPAPKKVEKVENLKSVNKSPGNVKPANNNPNVNPNSAPEKNKPVTNQQPATGNKPQITGGSKTGKPNQAPQQSIKPSRPSNNQPERQPGKMEKNNPPARKAPTPLKHVEPNRGNFEKAPANRGPQQQPMHTEPTHNEPMHNEPMGPALRNARPDRPHH